MGRLGMDKQSEEPVSPKPIMQIGMGFFLSKILLSAVKLGIFTELAGSPMTGEQIRKHFGFHGRGLYDFLDALTAMGFLHRDGLKDEAVYRNSVMSDLYLDSRKESYVGGMLEMGNDRLYPFWGKLETALQTGKLQNESTGDEEDFFATLYEEPERLKQFVKAMSTGQLNNFKALAEKIDFSSYKTLCDIGGADGALCIQVARQHPHITCKVFDLPQVRELAIERITKSGLSDRIEFITGSFWEDDIPEVDVITMGNILHDWDEAGKLQLLDKTYQSLTNNGACMIIENIIDDERIDNLMGLAMSLNMLIETPGGFNFSGRDFDTWIRQTGFKSSEVIPLTERSSAAIAYK